MKTVEDFGLCLNLHNAVGKFSAALPTLHGLENNIKMDFQYVAWVGGAWTGLICLKVGAYVNAKKNCRVTQNMGNSLTS